MDTVIFEPDLIEYEFVGVSLQAQKLWEESIRGRPIIGLADYRRRY